MKTEEKNTYDLIPTSNRIIVTPLKNPFVATKHIVRLDDEGLDKDNPLKQVLYGIVEEIGPEAKGIEVGDSIYFSKFVGVTIPYLDKGLIVLRDVEAICVIKKDEKNK